MRLELRAGGILAKTEKFAEEMFRERVIVVQADCIRHANEAVDGADVIVVMTVSYGASIFDANSVKEGSRRYGVGSYTAR